MWWHVAWHVARLCQWPQMYSWYTRISIGQLYWSTCYTKWQYSLRMSRRHSSDGYTSAIPLSSSRVYNRLVGHCLGSCGAFSCQPKNKPGRQMVRPDFLRTTAVTRCCSDTRSAVCHNISFVAINCLAKLSNEISETAVKFMAYRKIAQKTLASE